MSILDRLTFDATAHEYTLDGKPIEGVTGVLDRIMPGYQADPWYMQRGTAVHACAAMIARKAKFRADPQIAGQIEAIRLFWREWSPDPLLIEARVASARHRYGGTLDGAGWMAGRFYHWDYKGSLRPGTGHQLAAYAMAAVECGLIKAGDDRRGLAVILDENGKYQTKEYDLRPLQAEWLALLAADRVRRREGVAE